MTTENVLACAIPTTHNILHLLVRNYGLLFQQQKVFGSQDKFMIVLLQLAKDIFSCCHAEIPQKNTLSHLKTFCLWWHSYSRFGKIKSTFCFKRCVWICLHHRTTAPLTHQETYLIEATSRELKLLNLLKHLIFTLLAMRIYYLLLQRVLWDRRTGHGCLHRRWLGWKQAEHWIPLREVHTRGHRVARNRTYSRHVTMIENIQ